MLAVILLIFILIIILAYTWINNKSTYFKIRNIPSIKPNLFLGETVEILLQRCTPQDFALKLYNSFPDARYNIKNFIV